MQGGKSGNIGWEGRRPWTIIVTIFRAIPMSTRLSAVGLTWLEDLY